MLEVRPTQVDQSTNTDPEPIPTPSTKVEMPRKAVILSVAVKAESEIGTLPPRRRSSAGLLESPRGRELEIEREKSASPSPSPSHRSAGNASHSVTALHDLSDSLLDGDSDGGGGGGGGSCESSPDIDEKETQDAVDDLRCPAGQ